MKFSKERFEKTIWYKIGILIFTSTPFALLLSIGFFWYEMNENEKESTEAIKKQAEITNNLKIMEQSLSTKHIGIFPAYLDEINKLFIDLA